MSNFDTKISSLNDKFNNIDVTVDHLNSHFESMEGKVDTLERKLNVLMIKMEIWIPLLKY